MPSEMTACPHCGTANSAKKSICYHCHNEMSAPPAVDGVKRRHLRPRQELATPAKEQAVPRVEGVTPEGKALARELKAGEVIIPKAPPKPTTIAPRSKSALLGASLRDRAQMYRQMYSLFRSGIPLGTSLGFVEGNISAHLRPMLRDIGEHVQRGGKLSEAMSNYRNIFPEWEVNLVRAAEISGRLPEAMEHIAATIEREMDMRTRVNAETFPLKATAFVFVFVVLLVSNLGQGIDAVLQHISKVLVQMALLIVGGITVWQGWKAMGRTSWGARVVTEVMSRIPIIGPILKSMMLIRFTSVLGAMWEAGVAPMEALQSAARASGNSYIIREVNENIHRVGKGALVSEVLEELRVLPPEALYLLRTGESSGSVSESLRKVVEYLNIDLDGRVKTLPAKVQLIMYAVIGTAVGIFVIKFWTGYFNNLMNSTQ